MKRVINEPYNGKIIEDTEARTGPGISYDFAETPIIKRDTRVTVDSILGGWAKVLVNFSQTCFIPEDMVIEDEAPLL